MESQSHSEENLSSERIRQLGEIDKDVVKLLKTAGHAIEAVTQSSGSNENEPHGRVDLQESRIAFSKAAQDYFDMLSSIDVRLRHQIRGLEKEDILPAEAPTRDTQAESALSVTMSNTGVANLGAPKGDSRKGAVTGGGFGSLDVGWLNSRNDNVGKEMEAELWEEANRLTKQFEGQKSSEQQQRSLVSGLNSDSKEQGGEDMDES